jgi:hypothetical protein
VGKISRGPSSLGPLNRSRAPQHHDLFFAEIWIFSVWAAANPPLDDTITRHPLEIPSLKPPKTLKKTLVKLFKNSHKTLHKPLGTQKTQKISFVNYRKLWKLPIKHSLKIWLVEVFQSLKLSAKNNWHDVISLVKPHFNLYKFICFYSTKLLQLIMTSPQTFSYQFPKFS